MISREIRPGRENEYDAWFERLLKVKRSVPGYLGTTVISPASAHGPSARYVITRFESQAALEAWRRLPERARLIEEANQYSRPHFQTGTGMETWFALPYAHAVVPPPRWKMAVVTLGAALVVSAVSHLALDPFIRAWAVWQSILLFTTVLVLALTYVALPALTRALRQWLYPFRYDTI